MQGRVAFEGGEDGVLDDLDSGRSMHSKLQQDESILLELPPLEQLATFIQSARASFVREMAYGLLESAIRSYDNADWDELGQAIVDWAATLELEADKDLTQRLRRRRSTA